MLATEIRDVVLPWLRANGAWQEARSGLKLLGGTCGPFRFAYRTPFTPLPQTTARAPRSHREAVLQQRAPLPLPYGLDVWHGAKVLSVEWSDGEAVNVISFRPGPWTTELRELVNGG